jgi:hypothetical protein
MERRLSLAIRDKNSQQLCRLSLQIVQAGVRISEIHRALDNHVQFGSVPVPDKIVKQLPADELSRGAIARILCNYPPNITKARRKLASIPADDPEAKVLQFNIGTWEADLARARAYKDQE